LNVAEFISKWEKVDLSERASAQENFLDLCEVFDHPKPAAFDPTGEEFTFEKGAAKHRGGDGWADVWKKGFFGWEYKRKKKDLDAAYDQLLLYKDALENPPLLVVSDMDRIIVHTNFTGTKPDTHEISLADLGDSRNLEILRAVFHAPEKLRPGKTSEAITEEAASKIAELAWTLRERGFDPREVAHFLDRIVFALFAEDIELLPRMLFTRVLDGCRREPKNFKPQVEALFSAMANGGFFGADTIRHFNGDLFEPGPVLELSQAEIETLFAAAKLDWSAVDPSIFGTLFERGMDPDKRLQLGAHYTSREDIETLVEPVVMLPLRRNWDEVKRLVVNLLTTGKEKPKGNEEPPAGRTLNNARCEITDPAGLL
jgi:type II restriction/modification system DNA methylase subunit YeeA